MTTLNKTQILSETRAIARDLGMTFRLDNTMTLNSQPAYELVDRKTGKVLDSNFTLERGYENAISGYFAKTAAKNNCAAKNNA